MALPLNAQGSIKVDLAAMIRFKNQLPLSSRSVWNDKHLITIFLQRLSPAECLKVENVLDTNYLSKLTRTWAEFRDVCQKQVTLYRLKHPVIHTATAAAAVRTPGAYCFDCDQNHSGKDCAIVRAIVATNPEYKAVLFAKKPDPIKIRFPEHTLIVSKGFALIFHAAKSSGLHDRSKSYTGRGRGRDTRGGRGRGRSATASIANDNLAHTEDDTTSTDI